MNLAIRDKLLLQHTALNALAEYLLRVAEAESSPIPPAFLFPFCVLEFAPQVVKRNVPPLFLSPLQKRM